MGPVGWPETSVSNYHYTLCNDPEEHKSLVKSHWQEMADEFTTLMFSNTKGAESSNWALSLFVAWKWLSVMFWGMAVHLK